MYYLLYKLKSHHLLWVVEVNTTKYELINHIKDFKSKIEKYYIIERNILEDKNIDEELNFKKFSIFITDKYDNIIDETN
tara:strand:+ start:267 stop:503 length:237 start_codon:yes stop_codon:yes gene_type:complete